MTAISQDGNWLAHTSEVSGERQAYVAPFPGPGQIHRISINEGGSLIWAPDMKAIYYLESRNIGANIMKVPITTSMQFTFGEPEALFFGKHVEGYGGGRAASAGRYDIHPDGDRFLMLDFGQEIDEEEELQVTIDCRAPSPNKSGRCVHRYVYTIWAVVDVESR